MLSAWWSMALINRQFLNSRDFHKGTEFHINQCCSVHNVPYDIKLNKLGSNKRCEWT